MHEAENESHLLGKNSTRMTDPALPFKQYEMMHFTDRELAHLEAAYHHIDHPLSEDMIWLLGATLEFRDATTTDHYFKQLRDDHLSTADILSVLNKMGAVIIEAENRLKKLHVESERDIWMVAIHYARHSVSARLYELKVLQDKAYTAYINEVNDLKKELAE